MKVWDRSTSECSLVVLCTPESYLLDMPPEVLSCIALLVAGWGVGRWYGGAGVVLVEEGVVELYNGMVVLVGYSECL